MFEGIAEKATAGWQDGPSSSSQTDSQSTNGSETTETQGSQSQSYDTAPDLKGFESQQNNFDKQPQTTQPSLESQFADLSKFDKVKLPDGTEMTRDELTRAIMRQQDYTKKTQELSKQRQEFEQLKTQHEQQAEQFKYESNYRADVQKVLNNPALLEEFFKTYPKEYHTKIMSDLQRMGVGEVQQRVDPAYARSLQKQHEFESELQSLKEERKQENLMFVDSRLQSLETTLLAKYPKADMASVYATLDIEAAKNGIDLAKIKANPQLLDQAMEKLTKESHERFLKSYEDYAKEQSKKQIQANNKGSDIGRGGGTPGAPKPATKLKDVDMYAAMKAAGAL